MNVAKRARTWLPVVVQATAALALLAGARLATGWSAEVASAVLVTLGAILLVAAFVTAYRFYQDPWDELDAETDVDPVEPGDPPELPRHRANVRGKGHDTLQ